MPKVRVKASDGADHDLDAVRFVAMDSGYVVLVGRFPHPTTEGATVERDVAVFFKPISVLADPVEKQVEERVVGFHQRTS